jgi:hypothetical protein
MPRSPTELDLIEHHLQAAARTIRDSNPGDLEVERMRNEIYDHVYKAIEICARYAYARTSTPPATTTPRSSPTSHSGGRGEGRGTTKSSLTSQDIKFAAALKDDLDLLK